MEDKKNILKKSQPGALKKIFKKSEFVTLKWSFKKYKGPIKKYHVCVDGRSLNKLF